MHVVSLLLCVSHNVMPSSCLFYLHHLCFYFVFHSVILRMNFICPGIVPTCPDINNPENGRIVFSNDTVAPFDIGTKALYECDHGYEAREGTAERYCEDNGFNEFGFWTGSAPICVGMCSQFLLLLHR